MFYYLDPGVKPQDDTGVESNPIMTKEKHEKSK